MSYRKIYFAGGCFWGVEHFFKGVDGVLSTMPGYANGDAGWGIQTGGSSSTGWGGQAPTYEQVYTDTTGFAETVEVIYDPARVSLKKLVRLFFASIDPLSLNRQGHDVGTRYRTGVYYCDADDRLTLEEAFSLMERRLGVPPVTELEPLQRFWPAEERHRDYLSKNTSGYCHLPLKAFKYLRLYQDLELLLGDEPDMVARQAQTAALLQERMGFFWTGFYNVADGELVLGPFQGPPACFRIARGRGVCGTAWASGRTVVVPDVEEFPGHIACSSESRSEIVVPVRGNGSGKGRGSGKGSCEAGSSEGAGANYSAGCSNGNGKGSGNITAVLDIDSTFPGTFDDTDATWLELITELV
ncbi:MAG: peptide-methionine (S)-S-oxide reductase MsrA [Bacteroidales bacterium]|nr:peptide-methionine (S)-S-oxide reductase MsrA [Bacteroidales bacterium]